MWCQTPAIHSHRYFTSTHESPVMRGGNNTEKPHVNAIGSPLRRFEAGTPLLGACGSARRAAGETSRTSPDQPSLDDHHLGRACGVPAPAPVAARGSAQDLQSGSTASRYGSQPSHQQQCAEKTHGQIPALPKLAILMNSGEQENVNKTQGLLPVDHRAITSQPRHPS